jgi:hypothetical protein
MEQKGDINKFTITIAEFKIPLSVVDRMSRQRIRKDIGELSNRMRF